MNDRRNARQRAVGRWCVLAFGDREATSKPQRGLRLLEEAAEAAQAAGVSEDIAEHVIAHVWSRPAGVLSQELGGVGLTTLALAEASGLSADRCEAMELERVLSMPLLHFSTRNQQKNEAGLQVADLSADGATA